MITLNQQSVTVRREDMLAALKLSREQHRAQFEEAERDYAQATVVFLEGALQRAKSGDMKDLILRLTPPSSHDRDYAEIIEMLEASVDETLTLDRAAFNAYYRNEWSWTRDFSASAMAYKSLIGGAR